MSWRTCYVIRGRALRICHGRAAHITVFGAVCGRVVREGTMRLSPCFQSLPPLLTSTLALLLLISRWVGLCMFQDPVNLSNELSCKAGRFSCCCKPHKFLLPEVLRLSFPTLEPWVVQSVSLPSCSSQFICTQMWDCQPLPCPPGPLATTLPCILSTPAAQLHPSYQSV